MPINLYGRKAESSTEGAASLFGTSTRPLYESPYDFRTISARVAFVNIKGHREIFFNDNVFSEILHRTSSVRVAH